MIWPSLVLALILGADAPRGGDGPFGADGPRTALKPPPLQRGDVVGLVALASALEEAHVRAAVTNLKKRGFEVKLVGAGLKRGYLAGDDDSRARALNTLISDPEVKAILCLRGGYGSPRILDRIDYATLRRHPKIIVGYSDITAVLLAIEKETGLVTFHGPMGKEWSASRGISPFAEKYTWDLLQGTGALASNWGGERFPGMRSPTPIAEGAAEGILRGGNLSVICSLLGTPYEIDAHGVILLLEEVGEKPYAIDRLLNQLRLAGKLAQAKGILLGVFAGCDSKDPEGDLSLDEIFTDYFARLGIPVLYNYPTGHIPDQATLPLGVKVRLDATQRTLALLEPAVDTPRPEPPVAAPVKASGREEHGSR